MTYRNCTRPSNAVCCSLRKLYHKPGIGIWDCSSTWCGMLWYNSCTRISYTGRHLSKFSLKVSLFVVNFFQVVISLDVPVRAASWMTLPAFFWWESGCSSFLLLCAVVSQLCYAVPGLGGHLNWKVIGALSQLSSYFAVVWWFWCHVSFLSECVCVLEGNGGGSWQLKVVFTGSLAISLLARSSQIQPQWPTCKCYHFCLCCVYYKEWGVVCVTCDLE